MVETLKSKIFEWLEKSGYPLELFTYKALVDNGFAATKSPLFADSETGKAREIDILARLYEVAINYSFTLELVIECKKSTKPLIVICADPKKTERLSQLFGPKNAFVNAQATFAYFKAIEMTTEERAVRLGKFSESTHLGYSIIQAFESSDEGVFRTLQSLAKADLFCNTEHGHFFSEVHQNTDLSLSDRNPFYLTIPMLVIDAPVFLSYLGTDGTLEIVEAEWAAVDVKPFWQTLQRYEEEVCNIQIVRRDSLNTFLQEVKKLFNYLSSEEAVHPTPQTESLELSLVDKEDNLPDG